MVLNLNKEAKNLEICSAAVPPAVATREAAGCDPALGRLPPDVTEMTIPEEFMDQADEFKYEVLAREESWNQTAIESCFVTEEE